MTTTFTTPARRTPGHLRRAAIAIALAFGVTFTALPAQTAQAESLTYTLLGRTITAPNLAAKHVVLKALAQRGDPYRWGAAGPNAFDCSGLTQYAYQAAGRTLPHSSRMQSTLGTPAGRYSLRPGDLVFFYSPVSHVGVFVGYGRIVHAPTSGSTVGLAELKHMSGYNTARRIL